MPPESSREDLIIAQLNRLEGKVDAIVGCVNERVTWESLDRYKTEHTQEHIALVKLIGEVATSIAGLATEIHGELTDMKLNIQNRLPRWASVILGIAAMIIAAGAGALIAKAF